MNRLLLLAGLRHLGRHPWQLALTVLGVALGVAVVVAVDVANESAGRAFDLSARTVFGRATHRVTGSSAGLDEELFTRLVVTQGVDAAAPIVDGFVTLVSASGRAGSVPGESVRETGETLRLIGVDPFSEAPFRPWFRRATLGDEDRDGVARRDAPEGPGDRRADSAPRRSRLERLLLEPGAVALSAGAAARLGLEEGETLPVESSGRRHVVRVAVVYEPADRLATAGTEDVLLADIATAQELLNVHGRLSRIDLILPERGPGALGTGATGTVGRYAERSASSLAEEVRASLPPGAVLERAGAAGDRARTMTRAFRLNLTALALLALVVGLFLIYNTMTFSVVQRREAIGALRALGVTRAQVLGLVLAEAALVGLLGTAAGLAAGALLGRGLVGLVSQTINDLYFVVTVRGASASMESIAAGVALGMGGTLLAALPPALEATRMAPRHAWTRSVAESAARRGLKRAGLLGVSLLVLAALLLAIPSKSLLLGFAALFALLVGCGALAPFGALALAAAVRVPAMRLGGAIGVLATRGVRATLSRTGVAVAALTIAVSVTVGVGTMIGSFRQSLVTWLDGTLAADVYISPPAPLATRNDGEIDLDLVRDISGLRGVERAATVRAVDVPSSLGTLRLVAVDADAGRLDVMRFTAGERAAAEAAFFGDAPAVVVSEPLAFRHGLAPGSLIEIVTDRGSKSVLVAGVYQDYASEQGTTMIWRETYERLFDDRAVAGIALYLEASADPEAVLAAVRETAAGRQALNARSNVELRRASLAVFDRTFTVTAVLRALATVVAFIGVLSALAALALDRAREIATLRAVGMTPAQVRTLVVSWTGLLGLAAGLMALPVGLLVAGVMIRVINRRSFGWTLDFELLPGVLLLAPAVALGAALLAGLVPAWRMARTPIAVALRSE